uniref:Uncharacterized protein n=1 Tax=Rhizophora mucronata TaxID=61149 RepID=A0A2P2PKY5_RHIMU
MNGLLEGREVFRGRIIGILSLFSQTSFPSILRRNFETSTMLTSPVSLPSPNHRDLTFGFLLHCPAILQLLISEF